MCKLRIITLLQNLLRPFLGEVREEVLEALAFDIKAMLAALRKLRRQWLYQKRAQGEKGDTREWPAAAYSYDSVLLEMLTILNVQSSVNKEDGTSDEEPPAGCLFDVSITENDTLGDVAAGSGECSKDEGGDPEVEEAFRLLKRRRVEALGNL